MVKGYDKYTGGGVKVQKTPGDHVYTLIKIQVEEPKDIDKYRSFVGQSMWYTTNVGPDVADAAKELAVHMSHPGLEN